MKVDVSWEAIVDITGAAILEDIKCLSDPDYDIEDTDRDLLLDSLLVSLSWFGRDEQKQEACDLLGYANMNAFLGWLTARRNGLDNTKD